MINWPRKRSKPSASDEIQEIKERLSEANEKLYSAIIQEHVEGMLAEKDRQLQIAREALEYAKHVGSHEHVKNRVREALREMESLAGEGGGCQESAESPESPTVPSPATKGE